MTKLNIIFDGVLDDADIIAIPDEIASGIEAIAQEFLYWVSDTNDSDYRAAMDGQVYTVAETDGFIKWLNIRYCSCLEKAFVVTRNTNYCSLYRTVHF